MMYQSPRWHPVAVRGRHSANDALAAELAAGKTVRDAAISAGVAERTAFRRLTDAKFKARVSELRTGMIASAAGRLADGMASAADVLLALLADADPNVRHRAAVKVLELGLQVRVATDLATEMAELRELVVSGAAPGALL
jgi:HEAT repeat protein